MNRYKSAEGRRLVYETYDKLLEMWGVDKQEKDIDTRYGKTHVIVAGSSEKPPLLLFHGVGDNSAMMWIYNAAELSKHYYLVAVDALGGSGKSEPDERYYKGFDQTLWIDDVLDELDIAKTYVAGVSYGSYLTQLYTIERPDRVYKAVCMAGAIALDTMKGNGMKGMLVFLPEALFPSEKNAIKLIKKLCGSNTAAFIDNKALMMHWLYLLKSFNNRCMTMHKLKKFSEKQIAGIRGKTLVMIGDRDKIAYAPEVVKMLEEHNIRHYIVEDTGHAINHERADFVNAQMIKFFGECVLKAKNHCSRNSYGCSS